MKQVKRCKDCEYYKLNTAYWLRWCVQDGRGRWISYVTQKTHKCRKYTRKRWKFWAKR